MKLTEIETPVSTLAGIGPARAKLFAALGIYTVADLLAYYPRDWEDRTQRVPLAQFRSNGKVHTVARVTGHSWFGYGKMKTLKIHITDGSADAELVAFNRPFLEKSLPDGAIIAVTGTFSERYGRLQSSAFETALIAPGGSLAEYETKRVPGSAVFPVYSLTAGLSQAQMRKAVRKALQEYARGIEDTLPADVIETRHLLRKQAALHAMHCPETLRQALDARRTLIYEELYHFQTAIGLSALRHKGRLPDDEKQPFFATGSDVMPENSEREHTQETLTETFARKLSPRQKKLFDSLPFELTADQMKCISEMNDDIDRAEQSRAKAAAGKPLYTMARLVQGDVGSGKTLTAFFACLRTADWGGQCALLAPTELLARQHAESAAKLLEQTGVTLAFLTGNITAESRGPLLKSLKAGDIDIVIGTHALFSRNVHYKDLRLAVIDEQHRFGVLQRNAIIEKGRQPAAPDSPQYVVPSLLMLSATPIPRTLALTAFGDLDVSVIRTMPRGRLPVKTYLTRMGNEKNVYDYVRAEVAKGHQAYFVYPRIEESESDDDGSLIPDTGNGIKNAEDMYRFLSQEVYPQFRIALVHSRIEEAEQHRILDDFKNGRTDILVATSVVEVGVDVPNATCMVVEHADRFGMAALHQLRGRVGRSSLQSFCFLVYGAHISKTGIERMKALHETTDGFVIAEQDLQLRGPGEVSGIQQSGYLTLGIADPVRDSQLLELARQDAFDHIRRSPAYASALAQPD
ncbi:ATP-dependent DNA helicase RecG [Treponema brennaborense]|uniref:ATP-dependent DNA helicase RecG n=1 Tax=Treponema brennaborense (strain DSM 12168 / CIP 105900 / DD5/3) TaxID=906968 RepID=F4LIQ6_TREBD|nr:ATP-dependent DNA helicase RecG [Treponema brennaborense]AEE16231.1 ATP-dependent DNA helicase RecG [Treponema brennaborense DSM 12168]